MPEVFDLGWSPGVRHRVVTQERFPGPWRRGTAFIITRSSAFLGVTIPTTYVNRIHATEFLFGAASLDPWFVVDEELDPQFQKTSLIPNNSGRIPSFACCASHRT